MKKTNGPINQTGLVTSNAYITSENNEKYIFDRPNNMQMAIEFKNPIDGNKYSFLIPFLGILIDDFTLKFPLLFQFQFIYNYLLT